MVDVFLYPGRSTPADVTLIDPTAIAGVTGAGAGSLRALTADGVGHPVVDDVVRLLRGAAATIGPAVTHVGRGTGPLTAARASGRGAVAPGRCVGAGEARLRRVHASAQGETWFVDEAEEVLMFAAA